MVRRCVFGRNGGMVYGWIVRFDIVTSLTLLFRATAAVRGVHEKANKSEAVPC